MRSDLALVNVLFDVLSRVFVQKVVFAKASLVEDVQLLADEIPQLVVGRTGGHQVPDGDAVRLAYTMRPVFGLGEDTGVPKQLGENNKLSRGQGQTRAGGRDGQQSDSLRVMGLELVTELFPFVT